VLRAALRCIQRGLPAFAPSRVRCALCAERSKHAAWLYVVAAHT
jgi:hypothetical protein